MRPVPVALAVLALSAAALLGAAAYDLAGLDERIARGDARYPGDTEAGDLWRVDGGGLVSVPVGLAGADDDVALRRALRLVRIGREGDNPTADATTLARLHSQAEEALLDVVRDRAGSGPPRARRERARDPLLRGRAGLRGERGRVHGPQPRRLPLRDQDRSDRSGAEGEPRAHARAAPSAAGAEHGRRRRRGRNRRARGRRAPGGAGLVNELAFQTPGWALVALLVVLPLAALLVARRRSVRVVRVLALDPPGRNALVVPVVALVGVAVLVGTAAAQPVLVDAGAAPTRDDAEVLVVVDVSRSMLASPAARRADPVRPRPLAGPACPCGRPGGPGRGRLDQRQGAPASVPDSDPRAFATVLDRAVAVGRPLPRIGGGLATNVDPLIAVASRGYFTDGVRRRVMLVFTDGEVVPIDAQLFREGFAEAPPVDVVFVRLGSSDERVFRADGRTESYRADARLGAQLDLLAGAIGAPVVSEAEPAQVEQVVREALGSGAVHTVRERRSTVALAPLVLVGSLVPLAVLVRRRNRA